MSFDAASAAPSSLDRAGCCAVGGVADAAAAAADAAAAAASARDPGCVPHSPQSRCCCEGCLGHEFGAN